MLTIEIKDIYYYNQDTYNNVWVIYWKEDEIINFNKKIENQKWRIFNISIIDTNIIESQEDNIEELLWYLEYNWYKKIREWLYQK